MYKKILISVCLLCSVVFLQAQNTLKISEDIRLIQLAGPIFIHETVEFSEKFGPFTCNGMLIIKGGEAILIDTPMDNEKTETLVQYIEDSLKVEVKKLIVGHYHKDCMGGIDYIHKEGIESIGSIQTAEECKKNDLVAPKVTFEDSLVIDFNGYKVVCRYFGGGHTIDNIVVWLPEDKILFGGCLVKSIRASSLGNIADAVMEEYDNTIQTILETYMDIEAVVPGHGKHGKNDLLLHTIKLVDKQKREMNEDDN